MNEDHLYKELEGYLTRDEAKRLLKSRVSLFIVRLKLILLLGIVQLNPIIKFRYTIHYRIKQLLLLTIYTLVDHFGIR